MCKRACVCVCVNVCALQERQNFSDSNEREREEKKALKHVGYFQHHDRVGQGWEGAKVELFHDLNFLFLNSKCIRQLQKHMQGMYSVYVRICSSIGFLFTICIAIERTYGNSCSLSAASIRAESRCNVYTKLWSFVGNIFSFSCNNKSRLRNCTTIVATR